MRIIPSFQPAFSVRQLNAVLSSLVSFREIPDGFIENFELEFARYLGVRHAISVPSGRWGLYYILLSMGLDRGDEVIIPAFTYFAVPAVVAKLGLKAVFADTHPENLTIDVARIEGRITGRTRAIIPTHLCGFPCAMDVITDIAGKHNITVIEDCCQSLGAGYQNKKTGAWGEVSYFTFGLTKHCTTLYGGMVVTDNGRLAAAIRENVRYMHGAGRFHVFFKVLQAYIIAGAVSGVFFPVVYAAMRFGSCLGVDIVDAAFRENEGSIGEPPSHGRMPAVLASLGIEQLKKLDAENASRRKQGISLYAGLSGAHNVRIPLLFPEAENIFSSCPILVKEKKLLKQKLLRRGVDASSGYMRYFSERDCPHAAQTGKEVLYVPLYPGLSDEKTAYIAKTIKDVCS